MTLTFDKDYQTGEIFLTPTRTQRYSSRFPPPDPYAAFASALQVQNLQQDLSRSRRRRLVTQTLFLYDNMTLENEPPKTGAFQSYPGRRFCDFSKRLEAHWQVTLDSHLDPEVLAGRRSAWHLERTPFYFQFIKKGECLRSHFGQPWGHHDPDYIYQPEDDADDPDPPDPRSWAAKDPISSRTRSKCSLRDLDNC